MVSLGSDAANAGMMAVRHARIIQQLILASGNEASKAYEKWQRRGKASVCSKRDVEELQNDVRKAGNKMQQRRRANLLNRLSSEMTSHGFQPEGAFGNRRSVTETPKPEAKLPGLSHADSLESFDGSGSGKPSASSATSSDSSSSSDSDSDEEVPGLGFMRLSGASSGCHETPEDGCLVWKADAYHAGVEESLECPVVRSEPGGLRTGRRASLTAENPVNLVAQRRIAVRQPSLLQQPAFGQLVRHSISPGSAAHPGGLPGLPGDVGAPGFNSSRARPKRQSQWGQIAGLARLLRPKEEWTGPGSSISGPPDESGKSDVEQSDTQDEAINEGKGVELTVAQRRKLPEVFGISKFRDRTTILGQQWQEPAPTLKRFHLEVAERLGLDAAAGDWDPGQTYVMDVAKLEELAERKILRHQEEAATKVQTRPRKTHGRRERRERREREEREKRERERERERQEREKRERRDMGRKQALFRWHSCCGQWATV
ncbi:DPOL [Symbiodinium natans]|uniref:DPOL protein n=1 Tax=Symbiodinium natans TaxID=878477 RepID=A0A812SSE4_9DINO|nr:DPOL [Symbiodinium natans]